MDILHPHAQELLAEPQEVAVGQIRLDVGLKYLDILSQIGGQIGEAHAFLRHSRQEILLILDSGDISVIGPVVVLTPTDHPHSVISV